MDADALTLALCVAAARPRRGPLRSAEVAVAWLTRYSHASGLTYRYPEASSDALSEVDLRVDPGEFVVIAGRSGSGKSTLLRAACGLVPHFHGGRVEGEVEVAGLDADSHGPAELAEVVGLVAQEPETQVVSTTVRAEIELPLELRGVPPAARSRAVEEVVAGAGDRRPARANDGHPLRRRAAARRARGGPRNPAAPGAARRAHLAARPRRRRRADLAAPPAERGVGGGRAAGRAPARALPGGRRPGDRSRCRVHLVRWRPRRVPRVGAGCRPRARDPWRPAAARGRPAGAGERPRGAPDARGPRASRRTSRNTRSERRYAGRSPERGARSRWPSVTSGWSSVREVSGPRRCGAWTSGSSRGERVALMGRNGAGKSTLLRAAAGLVDPAARADRRAPRRRPAAPAARRPLRSREGRRRGPRRGGSRRVAAVRARASGGRRSPRPLRRRAPAPGAGHRARGPGHCGRRAARRAPAG